MITMMKIMMMIIMTMTAPKMLLLKITRKENEIGGVNRKR